MSQSNYLVKYAYSNLHTNYQIPLPIVFIKKILHTNYPKHQDFKAQGPLFQME